MRASTWLEQLPPLRPVDPGALAGLRAGLERRASEVVERFEQASGRTLEPGGLRLPKSRMAALEQCERAAVASFGDDGDPVMSTAVLRGVALDRFVIHQLHAGRVLDPVADLRSMLSAEGEWSALAALDDAEASGHEALASLGSLAESTAQCWGAIGPEWSARTQSRATVTLAAARVVCSGVVDVELGGVDGLPGVLVEVKSGAPQPSHVTEVALYALLVALRDGRAPGAVARWYPGSQPAATAVTEGLLESAAQRLGDAVETWAQLLAGRPPLESPGAMCAWCADAAVCPSASGRVPDDAQVHLT